MMAFLTSSSQTLFITCVLVAFGPACLCAASTFCKKSSRVISLPFMVATMLCDLEKSASLFSKRLDNIKANNAKAITNISTTVFCLILFKTAICNLNFYKNLCLRFSLLNWLSIIYLLTKISCAKIPFSI